MDEHKHCCEFCGNKYEKRWSLQKHIDKMHADGEKSCLCPDCGKVLLKTSLKPHMQTCQNRQNKEQRQKITLQYHCGICMKTFKKLLYLKRHKLTHEGVKFYECDLCEALIKTP